MSRVNRIAVRLVSQLKDFYVYNKNPHDDDEAPYDKDPDLSKKWEFHRKVADLNRTKQALEKWFAARKIPIRIVYADPEHVSAIPEKGVITFRYDPILDQEPPTAWMIVHNLAHGIFDFGRGRSPHLLQGKVGRNYADWARRTLLDMSLYRGKSRHLEEHEQDPNAVYPTTRSFENKTIINDIEAFYEVFTDWVRTGHVRLQSANSSHARTWERNLEQSFREIVDDVARMGVVVRNI